MSNTPNLKPCPFCGGINIIHCGHHMYCHACGADGPDADSQHESEAIAAWNRRTPQPVVREPLTDGQAKEVLWNEHLRWMNAAGLDTEGMRPTGEWLDHWLFYVRAIERAHGITQKGGSNAE